ncbi:hypothetical protein QVD17_18788 [Tagetes erecta]|uniref:Neoxanthin synthase n=1 Tax=Tagetes erecta TaxID=13708 RepID=A0AAD8KIC5_TARER|nr:hypothetical protein QVD17_18788 [Tagetes erecta]
MAISSCIYHHYLPVKINFVTSGRKHPKSSSPLNDVKTEIDGLHYGSKLASKWSFARGSHTIIIPNSRSFNRYRRRSLRIHASWFTSARLAGDAFTLATAAVLPFYILMVAAPKAELTKKCMRSCIPYVVLGVLYSYLLYLSWTPDTIRLVFSSKYWLPE